MDSNQLSKKILIHKCQITRSQVGRFVLKRSDIYFQKLIDNFSQANENVTIGRPSECDDDANDKERSDSIRVVAVWRN